MKPHEILELLTQLYEAHKSSTQLINRHPMNEDDFWSSVSIIAKSQIGFRRHMEKLKSEPQIQRVNMDGIQDIRMSTRLYNLLRYNLDFKGNPSLPELFEQGLSVSAFIRWRNAGKSALSELEIICKNYGLTLPQ